jgi:hypothetical protein
VATVPPIRLGVFTAVTTDIDDETESAWSIPALDILLPTFIQVLNKLQPPPVLPPNWKVFTGTYIHDFDLEGVSFLEVYGEPLVISFLYIIQMNVRTILSLIFFQCLSIL